MTYLIEGKIIIEEKPDKYFNRFVDFHKIKQFRNGLIYHNIGYLATDSEKLAALLNNNGQHLVWNEDLERAIELCSKNIYDVHKIKLYIPRKGWKIYLNDKFKETSEEKTIAAELMLWHETKPTYSITSRSDCTSIEQLENVYVFDEDKFTVEPITKYRGDTKRYDMAIDSSKYYSGIIRTITGASKHLSP